MEFVEECWMRIHSDVIPPTRLYLWYVIFHTTRIILPILYCETDVVIYVLTVRCTLVRIRCFWSDGNYRLEGIFPSQWLFSSDQKEWIWTNTPNICLKWINIPSKWLFPSDQKEWVWTNIFIRWAQDGRSVALFLVMYRWYFYFVPKSWRSIKNMIHSVCLSRWTTSRDSPSLCFRFSLWCCEYLAKFLFVNIRYQLIEYYNNNIMSV